MFPKCKPLNSNMTAEHFVIANNDNEWTMTLAHQVLTENMPDDQVKAEWRKHRNP